MKKYVLRNEQIFFLDDYYFDKPRLVEGADPSTFQEIEPWFAKDIRQAYFLYNVVEGADPASFVCLGGYNDYWAKDRAYAYHFVPSKAARNMRRIESRSLDQFAILPGSRFQEYASDGERVFRKGKVIRSVHALSFEVLSHSDVDGTEASPSFHFARDRERIYFDGQVIAGADPASFMVLYDGNTRRGEYGVDACAGYFFDSWIGKRHRVEHGALPETIWRRFEECRAAMPGGR